LLHPLAPLLELGAHRARAHRVARDEPDHEDERDVDEVGRRHLPEVGHQPPPFSRAFSIAASRSWTRSSSRRCRRHESRTSAKRMSQIAAYASTSSLSPLWSSVPPCTGRKAVERSSAVVPVSTGLGEGPG